MKATATDVASRFFEELGARGHEPILSSTVGTLRFDVADGSSVEHWYVTVKKGDVEVSHADVAADAVLRVDKELFASLATGTKNAMAAVLRGELAPDGDLGLIVSFQRLFPGPPDSRRTP
jgi:putative sterol carrier protein